MGTVISKAPGQIAGMFDAIAERYDFLNHLLSAGVDRRWRRQAVRALGLTGSERVLDLCTGTADLALALRAARPGAARVVGVDFAAAMLGVGQAKVRKQDARAIQLVRADATRIPMATASVDAVTIAFGIRNVERVHDACVEMHRVLIPGGRFAILEFAVPTAPLIRPAYMWYFNHVLPRIGRAISHDRGAYGYLSASVSAFATPQALVELLRASGFTDVTMRPLSFGIVCLYTGRRE
jgi:demethylmenaquinone methyltransferase/2-methoxy-6-polyprenyl-1,4-benzoquinol methylase